MLLHCRTATDVASGIVAKALGGPRRGTLDNAEAVLLMYCEIEKYAIVQEELIKGFAAKNPKVVTACVRILTSALRYVTFLTNFDVSYNPKPCSIDQTYIAHVKILQYWIVNIKL